MERYRVLEWLNFLTSDLHKGFGVFGKFPNEEAIKTKFIDSLQFMDNYLQYKKHLVDNKFTLADAYLFVILSWLNMGIIPVKREKFSSIEKFFNEMKDRSSIQKP